MPSMNRDCVVRDRPCRRFFAGANTAFIASPASSEVGFELEVLKTILTDEDIEPYVAVENFDPARDIFCTKICTKIIESKLCVVLLTGPVGSDGIVRPNPNVYYEYGLMTAWHKPVIPIQRADQKLAFNIQSLDTVKYSPDDFKVRIQHALRIVLTRIEEESEQAGQSDERKGLRQLLCYFLELQGNDEIRSETRETRNTIFIPFRNWRFGAVIAKEHDLELLQYSVKLLCRRMEASILRLRNEVAGRIQGADAPEMEPDTLTQEQLELDRVQLQRLLDGREAFEIVVLNACGREQDTSIRDIVSRHRTTLAPNVIILCPEDMRGKMTNL